MNFLKDLKLKFELKINLIAASLCALFSCFWIVLAAQRYYFLCAQDYWDMGFYGQTLWNLLHGSLYNTLLGADFLAEHCNLICFFFLPFYWFFPDPILLQYFKIAGFFGTSYVFFLILKKRLNPSIALVAMVAYCIAPANIAMLRHIFNYETFSIPLIILVFKGLDDKNYRLYIISCFILALVKEQMPLIVLMFGVLGFFYIKEDKFKWAWTPLCMGAAIFIIDVFVIGPHYRINCPSAQHFFWDRYTQFGKTPANILFFVLTHPLKVLTLLITPLNVRWYNDLFGIWGGLAFLSPQILLLALPLFLKNLLSGQEWEHVVTGAWYASTFTPFIYLATWNTLDQIRNKWRLSVHCLALGLMFLHAFNYWPLWEPLISTPLNSNAIIFKRMIDKIPPKAIVCSDFYALPFLANRREIYDFWHYLSGKYFLTQKKFGPLDHMDYLLIYFLDAKSHFKHPNERKLLVPKIETINFDNHWRLIDSIEDIALYGKNTSLQNHPQRLIEKSLTPFIKADGKEIEVDHLLSLEGIDFPKNFPKKFQIFPITMYWKCLHVTGVFYSMDMKVILNGKIYYEKRRPIGSTIYPTDFWKKNEYIKENYYCLFPPLQPGEYLIKISFYDPVKHIRSKEIKNNFIVQ